MTTNSPEDDLFGSDSDADSSSSDSQPLDVDPQPLDDNPLSLDGDSQPLDDNATPFDGGLSPLEAELSDSTEAPVVDPMDGPLQKPNDDFKLMSDTASGYGIGAPGVHPAGAFAAGAAVGAAAAYPPGFGPTWPAGSQPAAPWGLPGQPGMPGQQGVSSYPGMPGQSGMQPGYPVYYPPPTSAYAPPADTETFATFLFICRAVAVVLGALFLGIMLVIAWYQLVGNMGRFDPTAWTASEGDQAEANAKLATVKSEIEATRQKIEAANNVTRELGERFGAPNQDYELAETTLKSLSAIPWSDAPQRCAVIRRFMTIPQFQERVQVRLRGGMHTMEFEVGQIAHILNELADEKTQAEFQASIKTAAELRRRYRVEAQSMSTLMRATNASLYQQRARLLLEMGQFPPPVVEVLQAAQVKWSDHAILAFHPLETTQQFVRKHLSPEELNEAALAALKGDPSFVEAAAKWLIAQKPDDAWRERVLAALEPNLASSFNNTYPAAVAYVRWSDKPQLPRVVELIDSAAQRMVVTESLRLLARHDAPRVAPIVKQHFPDNHWYPLLVPLIKESDPVADAFVQAIQDVEPTGDHLPMLLAWGDRAKKEDTTWLRVYAEKIPEPRRAAPQSLYAQCQLILKRKNSP